MCTSVIKSDICTHSVFLYTARVASHCSFFVYFCDEEQKTQLTSVLLLVFLLVILFTFLPSGLLVGCIYECIHVFTFFVTAARPNKKRAKSSLFSREKKQSRKDGKKNFCTLLQENEVISAHSERERNKEIFSLCVLTLFCFLLRAYLLNTHNSSLAQIICIALTQKSTDNIPDKKEKFFSLPDCHLHFLFHLYNIKNIYMHTATWENSSQLVPPSIPSPTTITRTTVSREKKWV